VGENSEANLANSLADGRLRARRLYRRHLGVFISFCPLLSVCVYFDILWAQNGQKRLGSTGVPQLHLASSRCASRKTAPPQCRRPKKMVYQMRIEKKLRHALRILTLGTGGRKPESRKQKYGTLDCLASSSLVDRGGPHSPQTFVRFEFPAKYGYSTAGGTRWKTIE